MINEITQPIEKTENIENIENIKETQQIEKNVYCVVLNIEYDGSLYHGWQIQPDRSTVQNALQNALGKFLNDKIHIQAAGRTDQGVHAINQIAHLYTDALRDEHSWVRATNTILKQQGNLGIRVLAAKYVPAHFHARFLAREREYVYYLYVGILPLACFSQYVGHLFFRDSLDMQAMQQAIQHLLGKHDFSSFRSSECQALSAVKDLRDIRIENRHPYYAFYFKANAFLHHMVRNLMGLLLAVGMGKKSADDARLILQAKSRITAPATFMPNGLFFRKITYDDEWGLNIETSPESAHSIERLLGFN